MSPEERFTKIENALGALAEHQVQHAEDIRELRQLQKGLVVAVGKIAEGQRETDQKLNALIAVQLETEQKLQRWIDKQTGNGKGKE